MGTKNKGKLKAGSSPRQHVEADSLEQSLANIFYKAADSKYFRLVGHRALATASFLPLGTATIDNTKINECAHSPIKLYLLTIKLKFHKIFTCHGISFFCDNS